MMKEIHEYAKLFPMMDDVSFKELVTSIREDGLEHPIVLHEGKILDGRNRFRACEELQIGPRYIEYDGNNPLGYVLRSNLCRRHLSTSQRSMIAGRLSTLELGDNQHSEGTSIDGGSTLLNVSPKSVERAKKVLASENEELIDAVDRGGMSVNAAINELKQPSSKPRIPVDNLEVSAGCRRLLTAWDKASQDERDEFCKQVGIGKT